jgi:adenylate kinase family enzyme
MYVEKTEPIIDYYRKQNVLTEIDGDDTVENIFARIEEIISD